MKIFGAESGLMEWFCLIFLALCGYFDIRFKMVRVNWCLLFGVFCVVLHLFYFHTRFENLAAGAIIGGIVWLLSYITKEAIGRGDGFVMLVLGIGVGLKQGMQVFMLGLFFIMLAGIFLVVFKKISFKERIPFVPFLFLGEAVLLICKMF